MSRRKIVVDGVSYRWQMGSYLTVWRDDGDRRPVKLFSISHEELKGTTPDVIERGLWKKYGDGSVISVWPSEVAAEIRKRR